MAPLESTRDLLDVVSKEIQATRIRPKLLDLIPPAVDRWVLASNLQKAIRRGLFATAAATAQRLVVSDSPYFWSRLLVIAYEDVGLANPELCLRLLRVFRRTKLHESLGQARCATYFAIQLAKSVKSRALCDVVAGVEFDVDRRALEAELKGRPPETLISRAVDTRLGIHQRAAALRYLSGYRVREASGNFDCVPANREAMKEVSKLSSLGPVHETLYLKGLGVSEGMNAAIPLVVGLSRTDAQVARRVPFEFEGRGGVLSCALDRHTRIGLRCLSKLIASDKPLAAFVRRTTGGVSTGAVACALFVVEGELLDRRLTFPEDKTLKAIFEAKFMEFHGVHHDQQPTLLAMLEDRMPQLNFIRAGETPW